MKKSLSLLLAAVMIFCCTAFSVSSVRSVTATAAADSAKCERGDQVVISVTLDNEVPVRSGSIEIKLPAGLSINKGAWYGTAKTGPEENDDGDAAINIVNFNKTKGQGVITYDNSDYKISGKIFELTLDVAGDCSYGEKTVGVTVVLKDITETALDVQNIAGKFTVVDHDHGGEYQHDRNGHWRICPLCSEKIDEGAHTIEDGACTVCKYIPVPDVIATVSPVTVIEGTESATFKVALDREITVKSGAVEVSVPDGFTVTDGKWLYKGPEENDDGDAAINIVNFNKTKGQGVITYDSKKYAVSGDIFEFTAALPDGAEPGDYAVGAEIRLISGDGDTLFVKNVPASLTVYRCDHSSISGYHSDGTHHWKNCNNPECGKEFDRGEHVYDNACDTDCNICGATRQITHDYAKVWSSDGENHWHECTVCHNKTDIAEHVYDNACDTDCNICGATRQITHQCGAWQSDSEYHWHICSVCTAELDRHAHEFEDDICTVCGYKNYVPGDIDGKEGVSSDDAIYLLYHVFFAEDYPVGQPVDFDGSGSVNSDDAIYLLYHIFFPEDYPIA